FFEPASVAVVGASSDPGSVGHAVLRNLLYGSTHGPESRENGFPGPVYPVNPGGGEILGQRVFESLSAIGEPVDLMVVAIPPKHIPGLMTEAGGAGIGHAIVISAGFAEMGEGGKELQRTMVERAREAGIRIVGPNCLGILRPKSGLNASFAESQPPEGAIGLLSQSGALITGIISYANQERFGLSAAVSLGAKADVEDEDVLEWMAGDDETRCAALYVESFPEPRKFLERAEEMARTKPVVALKGGATEAGAKAASSHTGSLAGSLAAYRAGFAQSGVAMADSIGDFVAWSRALAYQPPAPGRRIAVLTNAGGPGVLSADAAGRRGLELARLSEPTFSDLDGVLPRIWSRNNPVDVIGDAGADRYREALNILGRAEEVDGIVVILTVQAMTEPKATAEAIVEAHDDPSWTKPVVCSFLGLLGTEEGRILDAAGIPELNLPEQAVSAMGALARRGQWLRREPAPAPPELPHPAPDLDRARELVTDARAADQENLDLDRARAVLEAAGIRYNRSVTVSEAAEAPAAAESIGYPVVVKAVSPDVVHKSDVGAVRLDLVDEEEVRTACDEIREAVASHDPEARITGFTVEEQVSGTEIIVGVSRDPDFGPLLMVGMGGIFVEVYEDVAFRLVPLSRRDALEMVGEIEAQPLLDGARGRPKLRRGELAEILIRVSELVGAVPEIREIDVNPLVITEDGLVAIDARVIVE
ncbi:MAG: acetate--CoA ligase family protein, partial [Thermoanaerobaculia bacterium]|nr:acetate--CoA ligase family protein [Thermoanaerobaculia bacterium]